MPAEDDLIERIKNTADWSTLNLPKSSEFVYNKRGQKLHVRTSWPVNKNPLALIVMLHGYAAHINRPSYGYMNDRFNERGIAVVAIDFHGHGHSEGMRALVKKYEDLVEDVESVVQAIYSAEAESASSNFQLQHYVSKEIPFFVMGQSMGGGTAIVVGQKFSQQSELPFRGMVLCCPAIDVSKPSWLVTFLLQNLVVPLIPTHKIPPSLSPVSDNSAVWRSEDFIRFVQYDQYPSNPKGLSWGESMRFQTADSLVRLADAAKAAAESCKCSFIIMHDPEDRCVNFSGSYFFYETAQTNESNKKLLHMDGGRHDLKSNRMEEVMNNAIEFVLQDVRA